MESHEIYHEERGEAQAGGDRDFPTYSEWLHNICDPHAERIRAEERIEMRERFDEEGYYNPRDFSPIKSMTQLGAGPTVTH